MYSKTIYLFLSISFILSGCANDDQSLEEQLIGEWTGEVFVEEIYKNEIIKMDTLNLELMFFDNGNGTLSGYNASEFGFDWSVNETEDIISLETESTFFNLLSGLLDIEILESLENNQKWFSTYNRNDFGTPEVVTINETWELRRVN